MKTSNVNKQLFAGMNTIVSRKTGHGAVAIMRLKIIHSIDDFVNTYNVYVSIDITVIALNKLFQLVAYIIHFALRVYYISRRISVQKHKQRQSDYNSCRWSRRGLYDYRKSF
jgi:hypothetical protein